MVEPIVVSAATPPYWVMMNRLGDSLKRIGMREFWLRSIECRGSWVANCAQKPEQIKWVLEKVKQPVVWIDADAVVHKDPVLLYTLGEKGFDVAIHALTRHGRTEFLSGTVWINYTPSGRAFVDSWIGWCKKHRRWPDQHCMSRALNAMRELDEIAVCWLPAEYCFIFDTHRKMHPDAEPVVEHFQASRTLKKDIG